MTRHASTTLVIFILIAPLAPAGGEQMSKALEGGWTAIQATFDGAPNDKLVEELWMVIFTGDSFFNLRPEDGTIKGSATFKLYPTKKPMHIDLTAADGEDKGKTALGICKLDGKTLTICFSNPGAARPTDFTDLKGSERMRVTFKRARPAPRPEKS